jgi:hypothetical protein
LHVDVLGVSRHPLSKGLGAASGPLDG